MAGLNQLLTFKIFLTLYRGIAETHVICNGPAALESEFSFSTFARQPCTSEARAFVSVWQRPSQIQCTLCNVSPMLASHVEDRLATVTCFGQGSISFWAVEVLDGFGGNHLKHLIKLGISLRPVSCHFAHLPAGSAHIGLLWCSTIGPQQELSDSPAQGDYRVCYCCLNVSHHHFPCKRWKAFERHVVWLCLVDPCWSNTDVFCNVWPFSTASRQWTWRGSNGWPVVASMTPPRAMPNENVLQQVRHLVDAGRISSSSCWTSRRSGALGSLP